MKKLIFLLPLLFMVACDPPRVKSPLKITNKYYYITQDGIPTCSLRLEVFDTGRGAVWTESTPENCNYNNGDILK